MLQAIPQENQGAAVAERCRPSLDERFLIKLNGKEFVTYAGLLDLAHQYGLSRLEVVPIQFPAPENGMECICKAMAVTAAGMVFTDIGDANPQNTNKRIAPHLIRMASTRAKARVLRDVTNIGITALEELGGDANEISSGQPSCNNGGNNDGQKKKHTGAAANAVFAPITEAQKKAVSKLAEKKGYDDQRVSNITTELFGAPVHGLSANEAATLIVTLQQPD